MSEQVVSAYEFGSFRLVPSERQLLREGQPVALPPKAFDTLMILVQHGGHVLKKEELLKMIWPEAFVEESNLIHYISLLRKTLNQGNNGGEYIETVRRYGYRFAADVREMNDQAAAVLLHKHTRTHVVLRKETHEAGRHVLLEGSLADAAGEPQATQYHGTSKVVTRVGTRQVASLVRNRLSVAVLIILILGAGLGAVYFGYRGPAHSVGAKTVSAGGTSPRPSAAENPVAREAYLKGRSCWNRRAPRDMQAAITYFRQALKADPNYAPAYAGLADAYLLGGTPDDETESAKDMARKALSLDDTLAEAHTSLAYYLSAVDWNWGEAESEFRRAIELDPNYATAHHWYAYHLASVGRIEEALSEIKRARELDPDSLIIATDLGHILYLRANYKSAILQYRKVLERDPNFGPARLHLAEVYVQRDMFDEALTEFDAAASLGMHVDKWLGYAYAASGQRQRAQRRLAEMKEEVRKGGSSDEVGIAWTYAALGEPDQAFVWLQEAYKRRNGELALLKVDPRFGALRADPRYAELLQLMHLDRE